MRKSLKRLKTKSNHRVVLHCKETVETTDWELLINNTGVYVSCRPHKELPKVTKFETRLVDKTPYVLMEAYDSQLVGINTICVGDKVFQHKDCDREKALNWITKATKFFNFILVFDQAGKYRILNTKQGSLV